MDQRKVCNTDYLFKVKRTKGQITIFEFLILQNKTKKQAQNLFQRRHCLRWPGWWKLLPAKWAFQAGRSVDLRNIPGYISLKRTPCPACCFFLILLFWVSSSGQHHLLGRTQVPSANFPWGLSHLPVSLADKSRTKGSEKSAMPPFSLVGRYFKKNDS